MARFAFQIKEALHRKLMNEAGDVNDGAPPAGTPPQEGGQPTDTTLHFTDEQISEYKLKYLNEESGELDMQKLFGDLHNKPAKGDAPESYGHDFLAELSQTDDFKDWEFDVENDPLIKSASTWAKENDVSQDKYQALITGTMQQVKEIQTQMAADQQAALAEEWKTVEDADARKQKVSSQLTSMLPQEFHDHVGALMQTPATFKMMEAMAAKMRGTSDNFESPQAPAPTLSREDISVLRTQRDKAEQEGDMALKRQLDNKISNAYALLEKQGKL